jgi:hypothetical protein
MRDWGLLSYSATHYFNHYRTFSHCLPCLLSLPPVVYLYSVVHLSLLAVWALSLLPALFFISHRTPFHSLAVHNFISRPMLFHSSPRVGSHSYHIPPYIISLLAVWAISLLPALFLYPAVHYFIACRLGNLIAASAFLISRRTLFHCLPSGRFHCCRRFSYIPPYIISLLAVWALSLLPALFLYPTVHPFIPLPCTISYPVVCSFIPRRAWVLIRTISRHILFHCLPSGRFYSHRRISHIPPCAISYSAAYYFIARRLGAFIAAGAFFISRRAGFHSLSGAFSLPSLGRFHSCRRLFHILPCRISFIMAGYFIHSYAILRSSYYLRIPVPSIPIDSDGRWFQFPMFSECALGAAFSGQLQIKKNVL